MTEYSSIVDLDADTAMLCADTLPYRQGQLLEDARRFFFATVPGKRQAAQAFGEWHRRTLGFSKVKVSRLRTFAKMPAFAAGMGAIRGYEGACAVRDGLVSPEDVVTMSRREIAALRGKGFR